MALTVHVDFVVLEISRNYELHKDSSKIPRKKHSGESINSPLLSFHQDQGPLLRLLSSIFSGSDEYVPKTVYTKLFAARRMRDAMTQDVETIILDDADKLIIPRAAQIASRYL
mmetsp:Transcript_23735/g.57518  ORF Transcript_23735/g.57518 Transcript_23735/m.57518 type:complete len:113 (+) Transcript_23735:1326-1664(+)